MIKMKQIYLFLSLVLLCACSGSDEELSTVAQQPCPALDTAAQITLDDMAGYELRRVLYEFFGIYFCPIVIK